MRNTHAIMNILMTEISDTKSYPSLLLALYHALPSDYGQNCWIETYVEIHLTILNIKEIAIKKAEQLNTQLQWLRFSFRWLSAVLLGRISSPVLLQLKRQFTTMVTISYRKYCMYIL